MRILYLALDVELPKVAGEAAHVKEATRALASLGHEVHLLVPGIGGPPSAPLLEKAGVILHGLSARGNAATALAVRRLVKAVKPDVLYERRFSPKIGAAVATATGLPLVLEVNGLPDVEKVTLGKAKRGPSALKATLRKRLFARVDRVVAVDSGIAEELARRHGVPPDRIRVIPNGADVEAFRPQDPVAARRVLGLPVRPIVGFVGSLYPWQGLRPLVAAAPAIRKDVPDVFFLLVGDGPERQALESAVKGAGMGDAFRFLGLVDHERVPSCIAAMDVCLSLRDIDLQETRYGYSPLKLYEYLAAGRPVVATRAPGLEFLEEEGCGVFVDLRDPDALAAAIAVLLRDPARRRSMGERARAVAVERFSWKAVAEKLVAVMREAQGT